MSLYRYVLPDQVWLFMSVIMPQDQPVLHDTTSQKNLFSFSHLLIQLLKWKINDINVTALVLKEQGTVYAGDILSYRVPGTQI